MRLTYRGEQEKLISDLATKIGDSPTNLLYRLARDLHDIVNLSPIDAQAAQEKLNGRDETPR